MTIKASANPIVFNGKISSLEDKRLWISDTFHIWQHFRSPVRDINRFTNQAKWTLIHKCISRKHFFLVKGIWCHSREHLAWDGNMYPIQGVFLPVHHRASYIHMNCHTHSHLEAVHLPVYFLEASQRFRGNQDNGEKVQIWSKLRIKSGTLELWVMPPYITIQYTSLSLGYSLGQNKKNPDTQLLSLQCLL